MRRFPKPSENTCGLYQQVIHSRRKSDPGISALLDLHGQVLSQGDGYWIQIEAWTVRATEQIPHGIRYSLTLHEPQGKRILGYDNAHPVKTSGKFKDAYQLLSDFFAEADAVLEKARQP